MIRTYLFSMYGCPHCQEMKDMLEESGIDYIVKDIDEDEDEYAEYQALVEGNEYVPAFLCVELEENKVKRYGAFAPDRDYMELSEALDKVKGFITG